MRNFQKGNKGLLNKERFKRMEQDKILWLKRLSLKDALILEESLISSTLIWEWRKNFAPDTPK
ncbi:MAG: hypothetical protein QMD71_05510 [bacterium]|nr:hypothetical protein [bacterium]